LFDGLLIVSSRAMPLLDRFDVVLFDLNATFMFGPDRFGPGQDYFADHELGRVPPSHVLLLRELSASHRLGEVSNMCSDPEYAGPADGNHGAPSILNGEGLYHHVEGSSRCATHAIVWSVHELCC
jgi:hypothetical protein